jgi:hypothetical protein
MSTDFSEQEIVRRESLQKLIDLGIDCYPAELFRRTDFRGYYRGTNNDKKNHGKSFFC